MKLEENENRKDLTAAERRRTFAVNKKLVEASERATEDLLKVSKTGRKPKRKSTQKQRTKAVGVSQQSLSRADQHVELAERYSWLQSDCWRHLAPDQFLAIVTKAEAERVRMDGLRRKQEAGKRHGKGRPKLDLISGPAIRDIDAKNANSTAGQLAQKAG